MSIKKKKIVVALIFAAAMLVTSILVQNTEYTTHIVIGFILLWFTTDLLFLQPRGKSDSNKDE